MADDFWDQYKSPQWQRRRLEAFEKFEWTCQRCLETNSQLHLHHKRYVRGRKLWEYADDELLVLCNACHEREHALLEALHELMRDGVLRLVDVVALVAGYREGCCRAGGDSVYGAVELDHDLGLDDHESYALGVLAGSASMLSYQDVRDMRDNALTWTERDGQRDRELARTLVVVAS